MARHSERHAAARTAVLPGDCCTVFAALRPATLDLRGSVETKYGTAYSQTSFPQHTAVRPRSNREIPRPS